MTEILIEEPIDLEQVADLCAIGLKHRPSTPRDLSVWHVTDLIYAAQSIVKGNVSYGRSEPATGIMSLGRVWESAVDCYLNQYAVDRGGVYIPDIDLCEDGIAGSLDGIIHTFDWGMAVAETKLRFSLNGSIPFEHFQQVKAYCFLAGVDLVCYVSGHLSSTPPTAKATLRVIRFFEQEIRECWQGIVNTRDYLLSQGISPRGGVD